VAAARWRWPVAGGDDPIHAGSGREGIRRIITGRSALPYRGSLTRVASNAR